MSKGYIYPAWLAAKQVLMDAVYNEHEPLKRVDAVERFFDRFMREFGCSVETTKELAARLDSKQLAAMNREKAVHAIARKLFEDGAVVREEQFEKGPWDWVLRTNYRVLVFTASPGARGSENEGGSDDR